MSIKEYLAGAKMSGSVQKLMTPGPSTTGIAVGGIGSTFTATPAGTTPVMNVMPGVQVRTEKASDLRFNNFFFKEAVLSAKAALVIGNFAAFGIYNNNFPLLDESGARVFGDADMKDQKKAEAKLNKVLADKTFFETNKAAFERWHIQFSDRTQALIAAGKDTAAIKRPPAKAPSPPLGQTTANFSASRAMTLPR